MPLLTRRELTAAVVAPLLAPLGYWLALTIFGFVNWLGQRRYGVRFPSLAELLRPLGLVLVVGAPIAWVAALVGLPLYLVARHAGGGGPLGPGQRAAVLVGGAAIGLVVAVVIQPGLRGDLFSIPFPLWLGALLGAAVAVAFLRLIAR
jgi:hypothetical protein